MIKTAVVGCGYWGGFLINNIARNPRYHLRYFCDNNSDRLDLLKRNYGYVNITTNIEDVLNDNAVDSIIIAAPTTTHFEIAKASLSAGKHVLVEQPLAVSVAECNELISIALEKKRVLLVDHTDEYNVALSKLKGFLDKGEVGNIQYIYSHRLNLGEFVRDTGVSWELASHDIYIILNWLGKLPNSVSAKGLHCLKHNQAEDVVFLNLNFDNDIILHIHASWMDPNKLRKITIVGSEKMIIYDDISSDAKITIFDKKARFVDQDGQVIKDKINSFGQFQFSIRTGDVIIPKINFIEPLSLLIEHFAACILDGAEPRSSGQKAADVVKVLEAVNESMAFSGKIVTL